MSSSRASRGLGRNADLSPRSGAWLLVGVLALGAFLRFYRLGETPSWYGDELAHLELARNLLGGEPRVGGFWVDWFGTIAHPPFYFVLGALSLGLFGDSIASLRAVSALSGTVSIGLLYGIGRILRGRCMGLLAAAAYAVFPIAVMLDRRAYAYPLVLPFALGVALCLLHFCRHGERRSLHAAAGCMSCLLVTGHYTAPLLVVFAAYVYVYDRAHAWRYLAVTQVLPLLAILVFTLPRWEPATFTLAWELDRAAARSVAVAGMFDSTAKLVGTDALLGFATLGVLSLRGRGILWLCAVFASVSVFLLYRRADIATVFYPTGAFLGFFALPFACLFVQLRNAGLRAVARRVGPPGQPVARRAVLAATLGLPALLLGAKLAEIAPAVWTAGIRTPQDAWTDEPGDLEAARLVLASLARPGDLVAGSFAASQGLPVRRTDLMQSYVYETGRGTSFYPAYLPELPDFRRQVFAFDCSLDRVDYLVLSRVDWRWTLHRPFAREWLGAEPRELRAEWSRRRRRGAPLALTLRGEPWPVLHRSGDVFVLENPRRSGRARPRV